MGIVISRIDRRLSTGQGCIRAVGKIVPGVKDKIITNEFDENWIKVGETEKTFEDGTNVDMLLKWTDQEWRDFLREQFRHRFGPGRYYVANLMGGKGLTKLFGPEYLP